MSLEHCPKCEITIFALEVSWGKEGYCWKCPNCTTKYVRCINGKLHKYKR